MTSTLQDHVVLLVDTAFFENLPDWVTHNFTVTPGGCHNGQASRNKLVIFADGSYLEFFNWHGTPPTLEDKHLPMRFWATKLPGLIDFAITDSNHSAEASIQTLNDRLSEGPIKDAGLGVRFGASVPGSRKKDDGVEIKWKVTRPDPYQADKTPGPESFANGRIDVPFFCHDVTERSNRVPCEDTDKTTHSCKATGIASCDILVPKDLLDEYVQIYAKIIGSQPMPVDGRNAFALDIGVPRGGTRSKITVRAAETARDLERMRERGIGLADLVIAVEGDESRSEGKRALGSCGIASTIWLEASK